MNGTVKKISIVVFAVTLAAAGTALARGGWGGYGYDGPMMGPGYGMMGPGYGMMGPGYGPYMMGPGMMGYGPAAGPGAHMGRWGDGGISRQQAEKLEAARDSFYRDTQDLRNQIGDRYAQIRSELSKENPDRARLQALQSEISKLKGELDQKQLDYQLEVRKIAPEYGRGFAAKGYGPGAGYCWR
jgi:zinc resistance-associated protein